MTKRQLRIAFFHLGFFYSGGGERLVLQQIEELRKRGHQVTCFTPFFDSQKSYPGYTEKFKIEQIFPSLPEWLPSRVFLQILLTCVLFPLALGKFRKFDVVIAANHPSPWFGYLINKFLGKPYVAYLVQPTRLIYPRKIDREYGVRIAGDRVFSPWLVRLLKPVIAFIDKLSIENCDRLLIISQYTQERLKKYYRKRGQVCYPGVEALPKEKIIANRITGEVKLRACPDYSSSGPSLTRGVEKTDLILASGSRPSFAKATVGRQARTVTQLAILKPYLLVTNRHFPQKRFDYAIRALKKLVDTGQDLRLVITGKRTEYTKELGKLVQDLDLSQQVIFTGFINNQDLTSLYQHAAVYLYTSPDEDFGLGILEAMAAGTPVVAWDFGGPQEMVVNGQTGYLAQPESLKNFSEKVKRLVEDPQLVKKIGRAGWQRAKKKFSWDNHGEILEGAIKGSI